MAPGLKKRLLLVRWHLSRLNGAQFRKWLYRLTRPGSYPYVSGDGFRRLADHVYDETRHDLSPKRVKPGDVVFVSTDCARDFFAKSDPRIEAPYILITHNSDLSADERLFAMAGPYVTTWFAQNTVQPGRHVVPIPIGLENLHHYHAGIPNTFTALRKQTQRKKTRILVAFAVGTNREERQAAYDSASRNPWADRLGEWLSQNEYMDMLASYKFVLSPPGNGLDTHRTWEAMYLGTIPVVKDSVAMRSFEKLGLPIWIVEDWDDLSDMAESDLEEKYQALRTGFSAPALFMDYWSRQVRDCRAVMQAQHPADRDSGGAQATQSRRRRTGEQK